MKIKYETDIFTCITPCPHGTRLNGNGEIAMVGSSGCEQCPHFMLLVTLPGYNYVECKFKPGELKTDSINPENITFRQVRQLKTELESSIRDLINEFHEKTRIIVEDIGLSHVSVGTYDEGESRIVTQVRVGTRI